MQRIHKDIVDPNSIKEPIIIADRIKSPSKMMRVNLMIQDVKMGAWLYCSVVYPQGVIPTVQGLKELIHNNFPSHYPTVESVHISCSDTNQGVPPNDSSLQENNITFRVFFLSTAPVLSTTTSNNPR